MSQRVPPAKKQKKPAQVNNNKSKKKQQQGNKKSKGYAALGNTSTFVEPKFKTSKPGCVRVEKTEYIADIAGTTEDFLCSEPHIINPGNSAIFPWLSQIAHRFESYKIHKLVFELRTQSSTFVNGFVGIAVDYNNDDAPPINKREFMNMEESVRCPSWENCKHISTQKNLTKRRTYFVRNAGQDGTLTTENVYDIGKLYLASGGSVAGTISELWVMYDVEFETPELSSPGESLIFGLTTIGSGTPALPFSPSSETDVFYWPCNTTDFITPLIGTSLSEFLLLKDAYICIWFNIQSEATTYPDFLSSYVVRLSTSINEFATALPLNDIAMLPSIPSPSTDTYNGAQDRSTVGVHTGSSSFLCMAQELWLASGEDPTRYPIGGYFHKGDILAFNRNTWTTDSITMSNLLIFGSNPSNGSPAPSGLALQHLPPRTRRIAEKAQPLSLTDGDKTKKGK